MIAKDLITSLIPPLKTSDTGDKALIWMHEFNVNHLPIVNTEQFLGLITEDDILDFSDPAAAIGSHQLSLQKPFVLADVHMFEVIKTASQLKLSVVPVLDHEEMYLGAITQDSIVQYLAKSTSIMDTGGILVLELNMNDYSMSEIARIVESNNAYILHSYVTTHHNSTKVEVTLKLNVSDLKHIIATFERFEYTVKASFHEASFIDDLKDNYNSLMNYLNI